MSSARESEPRAARWVAFHQPRPAAPVRLFCFPYAGGAASAYRAWASRLPGHIEVGAVQLPGRENRFGEPALRHMDEVAAGVVQAALPLMREKPFALFGHSLGAIVALEVSRALARAAGPQPFHVIVSARRAPHLALRGERLATLSREDLLDWLRRVNGTPEEVLQNRALVDTFLPSLRADLDVDDTYRSTPDPRLSCPLTAFGGSGDEETSPEELEAWADYTAGTFTHRQFDGDHFYAFKQAQAATLAALSDLLRPQ